MDRMGVSIASIALSIALMSGSSQAQDVWRDLRACSSQENNDLRLKCFDEVAKALPGNTAEQPPAGVSTRDVIAPQPVRSFQAVEPLDFIVAPNKFMDRGVEIKRARCFHADKNEFRCFTSSPGIITVFTPMLKPVSAQEQVENECGQVRTASSSPRCQFAIRFVPVAAETEPLNAFQKRLVVVTKEIELLPSPSRRK